MFSVFLVRHGETEWNRENRLQGHLDSSLTSHGREQAACVGAKLKSLTDGFQLNIVSSPLGRCRETAKLICSSLNLGEDHIMFDDRLKELCYGDWEGKEKTEIEQTQEFKARLEDRWNVPAPNGESYRDVFTRVSSWLNDLRDETVVAASHGCAGRILRGTHCALSPTEIANLEEEHDSIYLLRPGAIVEKVS